MPRVRSLLIALVALGLLAACTPAPAVTVSPTPVLQCTPESGGTPAPCSKTDYDAMVAKDALYAEAEAVYRKYFAERMRLALAGGGSSASPVLAEVATGPFLADEVAFSKAQAEQGIELKGDAALVWLRRNPGVSKAGSVVSMISCTDGRGLLAYREGNLLGPGNMTRDVMYFTRAAGGSLQIWGADGIEVSTCDS